MGSGVKRSLFSKPAWAAPAATKPDPGTQSESIFGRNVEYDEIVRAQKAERERKAAKAKARAEIQKSKEESEGPEFKRRRTSSVISGTDERARLEGLYEFDSDGIPIGNYRPVTRSTPKKQKALISGMDKEYQQPRRQNEKAYMINLDDGEDDELIMLTPPKTKRSTPKKPKPKDDLDDDSSSEEEDEYLRELKAKARQKALLQRVQGHTDKRPSTPLSRGTSAAVEDSSTQECSTAPEQDHQPYSSTTTRTKVSSRNAPLPEDDPEIKILIHSEIPDTKPLIVKRKASQSLQQVKEFWCRKFNLDEAVVRQVFFTWNGTRLFDSTTMRGIIGKLKVDSYQKRRVLSTDVDGNEDGFDEQTTKDPSGGRIMLEAVTQEIYDRKEREKERLQRQQDHEETEEENGEEDQPASTELDKDAGAIIIRLVAKNLEPMQLRVRLHTTVGRIMRGFAATRNIGEDQTAWLIFEGERLEPEMTVEEVGFENEEQVEVSVRGS